MITFFRRLREKLISEGNVRRYLLYAIGEIALVMIGILLALQVNNWNEERKSQAEVQKYISALSTALGEDLQVLQGSNSFNTLRLNGIFYLLRHADLDTSTFTEHLWADYRINDGVQTTWAKAFPVQQDPEFTVLAFSTLGRGFGSASFNKSVINEMYATGSFSNIQNDVLKQHIDGYYRYLRQRLEGYAIEEHEQWANETTRFLRDAYGIFTLDVSGIKDPIALIRGKKDVEHYLRYLALEVNYHIIWGMEAQNKAQMLQELIREELTNE